ncbi:MAG: RagB/SusD family nutrient uptake outer membrane protein [Cyclobacteriaceae bacterium]
MKTLKNIRRSIGAAALMILTVGCDSLLDVEPVSQVGGTEFWKTESDAQSGLAGVYDAMQSAYSSRYHIWGEMRSDNWQPSGNASATAQQLLNNELTDQSSVYSNWGGLYRMIFRANVAIDKIAEIPGDVRPYLAQAHALRAFAYFDAVRVWGSAPLYLEAISGLNDDIFRGKTAGSYIMDSVVIPDMLLAEDLMLTRKNRFQFSLSSIYCLQAEVYMHLQEYVLAKEALDKLVALDEFRLTSDAESFHAMFRNEPESTGLSANEEENGPELIFSIRYELIDLDVNQRSGIYGLFWPGVPSYNISTTLENKWIETFPVDSVSWVAKYPDFVPANINENDGSTIYGDFHRYTRLIEDGKEIGNRRYGKYNLSNYPVSLDDTDIVVYRYGGMLLLKAEVEARLGNFQEAVNLVNRIRSARELPRVSLADFQTNQQLIDAILLERQFELLGEGKRWWDLIRTKTAVDVMGPINGQTSEKLFFPIFFEHLAENPNLTQTPGY